VQGIDISDSEEGCKRVRSDEEVLRMGNLILQRGNKSISNSTRIGARDSSIQTSSSYETQLNIEQSVPIFETNL